MPSTAEHVDLEKPRRTYQLWNDSSGASVQQWLDLMADDVKMGSLSDSQVTLHRGGALASAALRRFSGDRPVSIPTPCVTRLASFCRLLFRFLVHFQERVWFEFKLFH